MSKVSAETGITLAMTKGPFQNNGASPWFTQLKLGTPGQSLKFAVDTGTNIVWSTSSLCAPDGCKHYADGRFIYQRSTTYAFTDCLRRPYSFGPWGDMQVETGKDILTLPDGRKLPLNLFLSAEYSSDEFLEIDWDGGIGIPSSSAYTEAGSSFVMQTLLNLGILDPAYPYVSFDWDARSKSGSAQLGGYDPGKAIGPYLFLPWTPYLTFKGVEYVWTTPLQSYNVGGINVANNKLFALDSGSSQFKGDDAIMNETLDLIARLGKPDVTMQMGGGTVTINSEIYKVLIEAGRGAGTVVPQFKPLGLTDLVLVGSVMMEYCYTVHEYRVIQCGPNVFSLLAVGMYIYNKSGGPQIITAGTSNPRPIGERAPQKGRVISV